VVESSERHLAAVALLNGEYPVGVLGTHAVEQFKGGGRLATVTHSHECGPVSPDRLDTPGAALAT